MDMNERDCGRHKTHEVNRSTAAIKEKNSENSNTLSSNKKALHTKALALSPKIGRSP
jgi:hypothetical protein